MISAILTALGGSAITKLADDRHRPVNRYEKVEPDALVFYADRRKNLDEIALRKRIEERIGTGNFEDFTKADYSTAKDFLRGEIQ